MNGRFLLELTAMVLTVAGFFLVSEGEKLGFWISAVADTLWILWAIDRKSFGIFLVNVFMLIAAVNGILN